MRVSLFVARKVRPADAGEERIVHDLDKPDETQHIGRRRQMRQEDESGHVVHANFLQVRLRGASFQDTIIGVQRSCVRRTICFREVCRCLCPTALDSNLPTPVKHLGRSAGPSGRSSKSPIRSSAAFSTPDAAPGKMRLFFAGRGNLVTGIDFLAEPIRRAQQKAAERGLTARFLVMDALALGELSEVFDTALDSGLFHVFGDDERRRYVAGLANVLKPGGRLFLLCFSDEEPGTQGPRRVSRQDISEAFAEGWTVEAITATRFEVRPDLMDFTFSEGGPKAWFLHRAAGRLLGMNSAGSIAKESRRAIAGGAS